MSTDSAIFLAGVADDTARVALGATARRLAERIVAGLPAIQPPDTSGLGMVAAYDARAAHARAVEARLTAVVSTIVASVRAGADLDDIEREIAAAERSAADRPARRRLARTRGEALHRWMGAVGVRPHDHYAEAKLALGRDVLSLSSLSADEDARVRASVAGRYSADVRRDAPAGVTS